MGVSKKLGCFLLFIVPIALIALAVLVLSLRPSAARRALPSGASEIQEFYHDDGFQGDFVRLLKASIPKSQVADYAARLNLPERYSSAQHSGLPLTVGIGDAPVWWMPPSSLDGAYFQHQRGSESFVMVCYHDGYVYFIATHW